MLLHDQGLLFWLRRRRFALAKVAVYSSIGLLTDDKPRPRQPDQHHRRLFMVGVLAGNWLFGAFIDPQQPGNPVWCNVYWLLAGACARGDRAAGEAPARRERGAAHDHDMPGDAFMRHAAPVRRAAGATCSWPRRSCTC